MGIHPRPLERYKCIFNLFSEPNGSSGRPASTDQGRVTGTDEPGETQRSRLSGGRRLSEHLLRREQGQGQGQGQGHGQGQGQGQVPGPEEPARSRRIPRLSE